MQRLIEEENLERERARAHMRRVNTAFARDAANMKAPALRKELEKRNLSTKGGKAKLLDRLATHLEEEHVNEFGAIPEDQVPEVEETDEGVYVSLIGRLLMTHKELSMNMLSLCKLFKYSRRQTWAIDSLRP